MQHSGVSLAQECFEEHVATAAFQQGVERGWWGIVPSTTVLWPHVLIWIGVPPRDKAPDRYVLRFNLEDYPDKGPTANVWDSERNARADFAKWPKGTGDVAMVFRTNWKDAVALYAPWDRIAMDDHADWPAKHPGMGWKRTYTIVHYLRLTHELLNSEEYRGL